MPKLPPFPENRKIREGGEDDFWHWPLMLSPLVVLAAWALWGLYWLVVQ